MREFGFVCRISELYRCPPLNPSIEDVASYRSAASLPGLAAPTVAQHPPIRFDGAGKLPLKTTRIVQ
jgi:hypothetical protein